MTSCKPVSFSRRTLHHGVSKYFAPHTVTYELHYNTTLSRGVWHTFFQILSPIVYSPVPLPPLLSLSLHICTSSLAIPLGSCPQYRILHRVWELPTTHALSAPSPYHFTRVAVARNETMFIEVRSLRAVPIIRTPDFPAGSLVTVPTVLASLRL